MALPLACSTAQEPAAPASWTLDRTEAHGALLSVWGSGPNDVWAAGGQSDRGLVLHNDGQGWMRVEIDAPSLIWWIYGFGKDSVYAVGERGLIMFYDGATWAQVESGTDKALYGLWGASGDDVWIVGGDPMGAPGDAVLLRGSGRHFSVVADVPPGLLPDTLYKIYGTSADDLVAVGSDGAVLRWNGAWKRDDVPTKTPLISLWGSGGRDLYAVGGQALGLMLHFDGTRWSEVGGVVDQGPRLYGVFTSPGQPVFAVGAGPRLLELTPGAEPVEQDASALHPSLVLHSVWGDGQGSVYAVGGSLFDYPASMSGAILVRR